MEVYNKLSAKPVQFKFGEYINQGFDFFKNNLGDHIVAYLLVFIMSIIPFCGLLAVGNYYKFCGKIRRGERPDPGEIFNFDDFVPYLILQLLMIAGIFLLYIPIMFLIIPIAIVNEGNAETVGPMMAIGYLLVGVLMVFFILYLLAKAFYIGGLISLKGVKDIPEAWRMSKKMSKGNTVSIILFVLLTSIISQLGFLLCGIGIIITIPLYYTMNYFAQEDAISQLDYSKLEEIGKIEP